MAQIRGVAILHSVRFVRERFGAAAHERLIQELPEPHWGTFHGPVREASWEPVADLVAYMEAARRLLAPDDAGFYRSMGLFAGRLTRSSGFAALLGGDPEAAARRAQVLWRAYYDEGRLEIHERGERTLVARIHDFAEARPSLCQRICGFWEGCFDAEGGPRTRVEERACAADGGGFCEMLVSWE